MLYMIMSLVGLIVFLSIACILPGDKAKDREMYNDALKGVFVIFAVSAVSALALAVIGGIVFLIFRLII